MSSSWAGDWQILYVLQKDPYNIYYHITHTIYWRVYLFIYFLFLNKVRYPFYVMILHLHATILVLLLQLMSN